MPKRKTTRHLGISLVLVTEICHIVWPRSKKGYRIFVTGALLSQPARINSGVHEYISLFFRGRQSMEYSLSTT